MADGADDSIKLLEQRRLQLKGQLAEFEKQLSNWRSWETDYELLNEELEAASDKDLEASVETFKGKVVSSEEVKKLLWDDKNVIRPRTKILDLLRHRLDYVRGNVDSISKRRDTADDKIRAVDVLLQPDMVDEEGLPLTEITEELDENDNVISSSTRNTADGADAVIAELKSHGVDVEDEQVEPAASLSATKEANANVSSPMNKDGSTSPASRAVVAEALARAKADQLASSLDAADDGQTHDTDESYEMQLAKLLNSIADIDESKSNHLGPSLKLKDASQFKQVPREPQQPRKETYEPVIPAGESPEDAALRREMLEYSLNEVGQIVAEMEFDEDDNDDDYDDDDDDDDEEDAFGRSTRPIITEEYRKQMLDLEKQLGARALQNVGPAPGRISPPTSDEDEEPAAAEPSAATSKTVVVPQIPVAPPAAPALKAKKSTKAKGVRFAEDLDVAEEKTTKTPKQPELAQGDSVHKAAPLHPLSEDIQERKPQARIDVSAVSNARKPSRFKSARTAEASAPAPAKKTIVSSPAPRGPLSGSALGNLKPVSDDDKAQRFAGALLSMTAEKPRYTPEGPAGKTHADVIERNPTEQANASFDDDAGLSKQALAAAYYEERNKRIYEQGGFQAEEREIIPVDENGEEIRPKVSRFKASRLKRTDQ